MTNSIFSVNALTRPPQLTARVPLQWTGDAFCHAKWREEVHPNKEMTLMSLTFG